MKVRKIPVVVEAVQWTGNNYNEVVDFLGDLYIGHFGGMPHKIEIHTLEGAMSASVNDWIIKGVNGEFYPCKPDIFAKTYEIVDDTRGEGEVAK